MKPSQGRENVVIEYADWTKLLPWLTQAAFILLVGLATARGMLLESVRDDLSELQNATVAPHGCGPAGSMVLDLLCFVPALLILLRRILDKSYIVRFTWAEGLFAAFALWAVLSTGWSGDKFAALVLSSHVAAAAAMLWAAAQLVRSWMRLRIVAGMCLGLLLVYIAQGLHFKFVDVPDTARFWQEHRAEEMRARNWQEGDFALRQYEQKIASGEMIGFHTSPNTFATMLVLFGVVVAGIAVQRIVNRDESGLIGITILPLPLAVWVIYYTHCNAAFVTPVIAAGILFGVSRWRAALNRKRGLTFAVCAGAVVIGALAVVGHGIFHGSLPSASLNFRWRYWIAAMRIHQMHPLLGVGFGNFGYWYLGSRVAAAAEEVKDPHNLLVRALAELGIVGAVLMLGWLARTWWEWTWPVQPTVAPKKSATVETHALRRTVLTALSFAALGVGIKIAAGIDLSANSGWVTYELLKHVVYGALLTIGYVIAAVVSTKDPSADQRPAPWVLYAMLAGLAVFLIHNTIDFSFFEAGPLMLFMLIGGAVLGVRSPSTAGLKKKTPLAIAAFAVLLVGWLAAAIFIVVPLVDAEQRLHLADDAYRKQDFRVAAEQYQAAFGAAPVKNADYAIRAARSQMNLQDSDGATELLLAQAIAASPQDVSGYLLRARYNVQRHPDQTPRIREDYEAALKLNPNDLQTRTEYAEVLEHFGDAHAAAEQYTAALRVNDGFDATEPKRFSDSQVTEIRAKIAGLGK